METLQYLPPRLIGSQFLESLASYTTTSSGMRESSGR